MVSPISNTVAEIFLQHLENAHLNHILESKHIIFYTRYVEDILMIYNKKYTTPQTIHHHIKTHPNLQFTPSHEHKNSVSFLGLLLIRQPDIIETDIHPKPTITDTTINYTSNHPNQQIYSTQNPHGQIHKTKTRNWPSSHIVVPKSEKSPTSLKRQTSI